MRRLLPGEPDTEQEAEAGRSRSCQKRWGIEFQRERKTERKGDKQELGLGTKQSPSLSADTCFLKRLVKALARAVSQEGSFPKKTVLTTPCHQLLEKTVRR